MRDGVDGKASDSRPGARGPIDKMSDPAALPEERAERRRRLTQEPHEFREDRFDLPKAKGNDRNRLHLESVHKVILFIVVCLVDWNQETVMTRALFLRGTLPRPDTESGQLRRPTCRSAWKLGAGLL
jgi:hypothetical protein